MCLQPIRAWRNALPNPSGRVGVHFEMNTYDLFDNPYDCILLPCGKCQGCLDDKRKRWINRLLLEFDTVGVGTFITLTYADAPEKPLKSHVQKFLKKFRNASRDYGVPSFDFKYFFVAEHGGERGRPHYHALFFGVDLFAPEWLPYLVMIKDGEPVYSSKVLEKIWNKGFVTIGEITPRRCRYIAKYTMKQVGQENNFTLKSMRLGVSSFFNVKRVGRKIIYSYRYPDSFDRLLDGTIHINSDGRLTSIRIPPSVWKYVDKVDDEHHFLITTMRQYDAKAFFRKNFDKDAYISRLVDADKKDMRKRILHNDM